MNDGVGTASVKFNNNRMKDYLQAPSCSFCKTGVTFPGGYCTIRQACPTGGSADGCSSGSSICHDPLVGANYCVDRCTGTGQGTCRAGYACASQGAVRGCVPVI